MKPVQEQVILVTGTTDGIGKLTARDLAQAGATVLLHGRDPQRLQATRQAIQAETGSDRLETYLADFSSLQEVARLADEVKSRHDRLDVLINNAGIGGGPPGQNQRQISQDGYELRFAVNYLAPFLLTELLLPLLKQAAPSRIVNVASAGQHPLDFNDVMLERRYSPGLAYSQSKLALILFTIELAERLKGEQISVNSLHPGTYLNTGMVRESGITPLGDAQSGANAVVYLATSPDLEGVTGQYFDRTRPARADTQAYESQSRRRLWEISEAYTRPFARSAEL